MIIPDTDHWNHPGHFYDPGLLAYLGLIFDPGRDVVDVGANVGYVTRFFAERSRSRVLGIEPSQSNYSALRENVSGLDNVVLINAAVGKGDRDFLSFVDNGTVTSHVDLSGRSRYLRKVRAETLDVLSDGYDAGLVKIDVEGYEMVVLGSAQALIARRRPTFCIEVVDKWLRRYGTSRSAIFSFFERLGYQTPVNKFGRSETADGASTDLIFAPDGVYLPRLYVSYERDRKLANPSTLF